MRVSPECGCRAEASNGRNRHGQKSAPSLPRFAVQRDSRVSVSRVKNYRLFGNGIFFVTPVGKYSLP